jgi:hypothetical protein
LDACHSVVKDDARMISDADTVAKIYGYRPLEAHRSTDTVTDLLDAIAAEAEMATRLAAAERRALREEVQRRPHPEPLRRSPPRLDFIDAEPEARPRQPADPGNRLLDQPPQFVLRSLPKHGLKRSNSNPERTGPPERPLIIRKPPWSVRSAAP